MFQGQYLHAYSGLCGKKGIKGVFLDEVERNQRCLESISFHVVDTIVSGTM